MAHGLCMIDQMLALARCNARQAGAINADVLAGQIEASPLLAATVDVVISNCFDQLRASSADREAAHPVGDPD